VFLSRHFIPLMRAKMEEVVEAAADEGGAALQAVLLRLVKYAEQLVVQLQEVCVGRQMGRHVLWVVGEMEMGGGGRSGWLGQGWWAGRIA
jgi:hypothetical protein